MLPLVPVQQCELFARGFVDLSASSSQNGLINEDSSLAETSFLTLTHNTKKCWAEDVFEELPALISGTPPSWYHDATWAHVKLRWIYALPTVIILFLHFLFTLTFPLYGPSLGDPIHSTRQLSTGQPGRAEKAEMWKSISRIPQNTKTEAQGKSHATHWTV